MKNGKEYKTELTLKLDELINALMPKDIHEIKIFHFNIFDGKGKSVAIIGSEVSSIEYFVKIKANSWD
jgi:hypothetical protein